MSSMTPPSKDDRKTTIVESGRNFPEGELKEEVIKYYQVTCPKCRAQAGYPCTFGGYGQQYRLDPWSIHIARVILYERFAVINEGVVK